MDEKCVYFIVVLGGNMASLGNYEYTLLFRLNVINLVFVIDVLFKGWVHSALFGCWTYFGVDEHAQVTNLRD
jgi:hypothetical protein